MATSPDEWVARIAGKLTWERICKIAVKYMAFECQDLENVKTDNTEQSIREALIKYDSKLLPEDTETATAKEVCYVQLITTAEQLN